MNAKTIRSETIGSATLRLVATGGGYVGLAIEKGRVVHEERGPEPEAVWHALQAHYSSKGRAWFGHGGARARFLECFPGGFRSEAFEEHERGYKMQAKALLDSSVPVEAALDGRGYGASIMKVFQATNLLSVFEKARLKPLLTGPDADAFIQASARMALGSQALHRSLSVIERQLQRHGNAKWTVATYLPYLWRPDTHIFLKPEVTRDFAARVQHRLSRTYTAELDSNVYEDMLDLAGDIRMSVEDLGPRDMIDVQSYIWIVGAYDGSETTETMQGTSDK